MVVETAMNDNKKLNFFFLHHVLTPSNSTVGPS